MPGRMSNRERIARLAAEKDAERREREETRSSPETGSRSRARKPAKPSAVARAAAVVPRRLVWVVCDHTGSTVKTYPYPEREAADAEAERLTSTKGKLHFVQNDKVEME